MDWTNLLLIVQITFDSDVVQMLENCHKSPIYSLSPDAKTRVVGATLSDEEFQVCSPSPNFRNDDFTTVYSWKLIRQQQCSFHFGNYLKF